MATEQISPTIEEIQARRELPEPTQKVAFQIGGLYGISREGLRLPLSKTESIDSGQVAMTLDPQAPSASNFGMVDFENRKLRVQYHVQCLFPGLHDLVTEGKYDRNLLHPIRATATDDCDVYEDYSGWHARGRMDFLPGSMWSGAGGG
ncbi:MAG TPA: hypothetical protein VF517_16230 [Thermoleophilaceae bacterium]|jgi:hypothetical protein